MLRAIAWILWGCISWADTHLFLPLRRITRQLSPKRWLGSHMKRLKERWVTRTARIAERSQHWALQRENLEIREFRKRIGARYEEGQEFASYSVISVYEKLRLYLLTNTWTLSVQRFHFIVASVCCAFSFLFSYELLLVLQFFPLQDISTIVGSIALLSLVGSVAVFLSVFRQIQGKEKWLLPCIVVIAMSVWFVKIVPVYDDMEMGLFNFAILALLCLGGLLSLVSFLAFMLQWRLLHWYQAIANWMGAAASSGVRQTMISRVAAWILLMAPNRNGTMGWSSAEDIEFLQKVNRVEREGAEWRGLALSILAWFGITNLGKLVSGVDTGSVSVLVSLANPAHVMGTVLLLLTAWGILLELWLSEFPNQIIGLACVQACHHLANGRGRVGRKFENYELITTRSPDSVAQGLRSRWNLIAKHRIGDDKWRCLVEARQWLGVHNEHDDGNH